MNFDLIFWVKGKRKKMRVFSPTADDAAAMVREVAKGAEKIKICKTKYKPVVEVNRCAGRLLISNKTRWEV
jgi:hypothetical protein